MLDDTRSSQTYRTVRRWPLSGHQTPRRTSWRCREAKPCAGLRSFSLESGIPAPFSRQPELKVAHWLQVGEQQRALVLDGWQRKRLQYPVERTRNLPTAKFGAEHSGRLRLTFDELPSLHFTKMVPKCDPF